MGIWRTLRRKALWICALLVAFLVIPGCAGIKPYEPRDHREEGPEKGLFTGSEGEFVILRKEEETKKESGDRQSKGEAENTGQPKVDNDQREITDPPTAGTP
jgi:hypothetical protein